MQKKHLAVSSNSIDAVVANQWRGPPVPIAKPWVLAIGRDFRSPLRCGLNLFLSSRCELNRKFLDETGPSGSPGSDP